jgi:ABC-type transport system involved in multi-copper enzyme maturation permease subunit
MITIAPYESTVRPGRDGFGWQLRAEWTKFRTVRGWVIAMLIAALLPVAVAFLSHDTCSINTGSGPQACPSSPIGPSGEAVTDSFYFAHQSLTGNGTITARVTSLTGEYSAGGGMRANGTPVSGFTHGLQPWSKAGIMIKASTKQGSAYAAMLVTGANGVRVQWNYTGDTAGLPGAVSASSPRWLRLTRSGDTVTGYDSPDGTHWTLVDRVTLSGLPQAAQVGLFATSPGHTVTTTSFGGSSSSGGPSLATGTFDNVGLSWAGAGSSFTGTRIGGSGPGDTIATGGGPGRAPGGQNPFNGTFTKADGTYAVTGSGDIAPDVPEAPDGNGMSTQNALTGMVFALIAVIIVAALFITAEYRRGLIRTTFTASPRRARVLAAKAVVIGGVTFGAAIVGALVALKVGEQQMRSGGNWLLPVPALTEVRMVVGIAAVLAVAAVLALALGTLTRHGVTAVATVIVVIFLPFLLGTLQGLLPLTAQEWLLRLTPAAGFAVLQQLPAYHQVFTQYTPANGYFTLAPWTGFAVLCAWAGAALLAADYVLRRRDV